MNADFANPQAADFHLTPDSPGAHAASDGVDADATPSRRR